MQNTSRCVNGCGALGCSWARIADLCVETRTSPGFNSTLFSGTLWLNYLGKHFGWNLSQQYSLELCFCAGTKELRESQVSDKDRNVIRCCREYTVEDLIWTQRHNNVLHKGAGHLTFCRKKVHRSTEYQNHLGGWMSAFSAHPPREGRSSTRKRPFATRNRKLKSTSKSSEPESHQWDQFGTVIVESLASVLNNLKIDRSCQGQPEAKSRSAGNGPFFLTWRATTAISSQQWLAAAGCVSGTCCFLQTAGAKYHLSMSWPPTKHFHWKMIDANRR